MIKLLPIVFAIFIPPLAMLNKGWDKFGITFLLWVFTGIGGTLAALYFLLDGSAYDDWKYRQQIRYATPPQKPKRQARNYIRVADGEILEVVDTNDEERRQRLSNP
jgi:uncharacterized membrane protein YqaE (UPF0057 family)